MKSERYLLKIDFLINNNINYIGDSNVNKLNEK